MAEYSDEELSQILGNDPIATSVRIRIRQDEQAVSNLTLGYRAVRQEIEGIVKALREAGGLTKDLSQEVANTTGPVGSGRVGKTPVAGRTFKTTPTDKGVGTNGVTRPTDTGAAGQRPRTPGTITPTPPDKGVGTITSIGQRLVQGIAANYGPGGGGSGGGGFTGFLTGGGGGTPSIKGALADALVPAINAIADTINARAERNRPYSLTADRMNMLYQQMSGLSQRQTQDVYRQPLTNYKLGPTGINDLLAMQATSGLNAGVYARGVESMRIASGFSMTSQDATRMLQNMASPEVANRMFMMTGTSLIGPGGQQKDSTQVMQEIVQKAGLTNPDILRNAALPGSVTRANLATMGITGDQADLYIQYAKENLAYQRKGGKGMYDPSNKAAQKVMGISNNFAMQAEETERVRGKREENFYSRQADNFADLEKQTQAVTKAMGGLEDKLSGIVGAGIKSGVIGGKLAGLGTLAGGIIGAPLGPGGAAVGAAAGNLLGRGIGWLSSHIIGDLMPATKGGGSTSYVVSPYGAMPTKTTTPTPTVTTVGATKPSTTTSESINRNTGVRGVRKVSQPSTNPSRTAFSARKPGVTGNERLDAYKKGWVSIGRDNELNHEAFMAFTKVYYHNQQITLSELARTPEFMNLHPEMQKNFQDAAIAANQEGTIIGIESGWRSNAQQDAMFRDRYTPVGYKTDHFFEGQYWDKKDPSYADAAVPGASWSNHEQGLAIDARGDLTWLQKNAKRFGFENFANVNDEPWHFQLAGLRDKQGGGAAYNKESGFKPPQIEIGANGYTIGGKDANNKAIQTLYDAGVKTVNWTKNVNGKQTQIGIDYMPVITGYGKDKNPIIDFRKTQNGEATQRSVLFGSADTMERWLSGGKIGMPPVSQSANSQLMNSLSNGSSGYGTGAPGSEADYVSFEDAAKIMKEMGMTGDEIVQALSIMGRESGGNRFALRSTNEEYSVGLFQTNVHPQRTSVEENFKAWGISSPNDLTDPRTSIRILVEHLRYNAAHGKDPFYNWGPYKGMPSMYGTKTFFDKALSTAQSLGYIQTYTGPGPVGDLVPNSKGNKGRVINKESRIRDMDRPSIEPHIIKEHIPTPSPSGLAHMSDMGMSRSGASAPVINEGSTITISPTITINTNGATVEQELEGMARKVAAMLEKEVNRVTLRRT